MALDTMDKVVALLASGQNNVIYKASIANTAAGQFASLWRATGMPTQGAVPAGFATCDNALAGGLSLPTLSALKGYVGRVGLTGVTANTWVLYDRLGHMGGLSGTIYTPTAQTVNVDLVTASTNGRCSAVGADVDWFLEIYSDLGGTSVTATVAYNDQSNGAQTAAGITLGTTPRASRLYQIIPNAGTTIKKVNTVTLSATTGTAGSFGVTARKRLCGLGQPLANVSPSGDFAAIGAPEYKQTSCLELVALCTTSSTGIVMGEILLGTA
jgi:hypothetical protein